jgi:NADH pyrophosphatase NudC (nudix superfamily)
MTREEAIAIIRKEYLCVDRDCDIEKNCGRCDLMMPSKEPILEAYKMAIQALEQEPSGDLISREEVLENAFKIYTHECGLLEVVGVATIKTLPSIKPQESKTGHWEEVGDEYIQVYDLNGIQSCGDERICSECGFETVFIGEHCSQYKFCPNCGARMEGEQHG